MWTRDFERFVEPARRAPQLWRLGLGLVLIAAAWVGSTMALVGMLRVVAGPDGQAAWAARLQGGSSPTATVLLLLTFAGLAGGTVAAARWLHGRAPHTLVGHSRGWGQGRSFFVGAVALLVVVGALSLVPVGIGLAPNQPVVLFLSFLPIALAALLLQTGAEELAFRGYVQTQLAARFRSPVVWMVLPSVVFGLMHLSAGLHGANALLVVGATAVVGLIAADLTRVTGGIGAAWGLHFANNAVAVLVVSMDGPLGGLSLYRAGIRADDPALGPLIAMDVLALVVVWALLRFWFARSARLRDADATKPRRTQGPPPTLRLHAPELRARTQPPI